jgi:hypothetical protein
MSHAEVLARWRRRREEWARFGVQVDGATLCDEVLADLSAALNEPAEASLNLTEAAARSGYSRAHLGRLLRDRKLPNAGRPHAPRIRLADLPRKAGHLPSASAAVHVRASSTRQVVRAIVGHREETAR